MPHNSWDPQDRPTSHYRHSSQELSVIPFSNRLNGYRRDAQEQDARQESHTAERLRVYPPGSPRLSNTFIERHQHLSYSSHLERITGMMLELYLPGFRVRPGDTHHYLLNPEKGSESYNFDFRISDNVFVEVHWPRHGHRRDIGDCVDHEESALFRKLKQLVDGQDEKFKDFVDTLERSKLTENFYDERRRVLNQTHPDAELIVARTPEEVYDRVIARFGMNVPTRQAFCQTFGRLWKSPDA